MEDIVHGTFSDERQEVERRLGDVLDAVARKDFKRLASFHLDSPKFSKFSKFSKFNDNAPLERQDIDVSNQIEQDELGSVDNFKGEFDDLRIDVFGPVAITTSIFRYTFEADGCSRTRLSRRVMNYSAFLSPAFPARTAFNRAVLHATKCASAVAG